MMCPGGGREIQEGLQELMPHWQTKNLLPDGLSVLDIAWFIYANRLTLAGYPIARLHPNLGAWYARLEEMPEIAREITLPRPLRKNSTPPGPSTWLTA